MVGVEKGREFRFLGDLYSQESTFPLVRHVTAAMRPFAVSTAATCSCNLSYIAFDARAEVLHHPLIYLVDVEQCCTLKACIHVKKR